jgi:CheY-like chemotaxis protein
VSLRDFRKIYLSHGYHFMNALLLSNDLMTQSKVSDACRIAGFEFKAAPTMERLIESVTESAIVILDLAMPNYDVAALVSQLHSLPAAPGAILAFGPHVHEARLQAAADAGCDAIFARGQFFAQTAAILERFA